jgi:4-amino-4-deoxy-L-arabinose transferase-like glycosyltransferase
MVGYSLLFPTYRAPDEHQHFDLVVAMSGRRSYPAYDELQMDARTEASMDQVLIGRKNLVAEEVPPRPGRPSYFTIAPAGEGLTVNRMPSHPPLYYATLGTVVRGLRVIGLESLAHDQTAWALRLLNIILAAPLPLLAYLATTAATTSAGAGIAAAAVPLVVPQLAHVSSSINNDNLLLLLVGILTVLLIRVITGDVSLRTASLVGLTTGLALFTKGFALVLPAWVILAYVLAWRRHTSPGLAATRLALAGAIAVVAGGWWWFRNLVVLGKIQAAVPQYQEAPGFDPDPVWWVRRFATWFVESFWGWMGSFEVRLPEPAIALAMLVVAATIVAAFVMPAGRRLLDRADTAFLLFPMLAIVPIVVRSAWSVYADTGLTAGIQGRYLFSGMAALAVVLGSTWAALRADAARWVVAAAALMQLVAAVVIVSTYYGAPGSSPTERLGAWLAWAPWPAPIEIIVIGAIVTGFVIVFTRLSARSDQPSRV